jgi:hypothetical protein
VHKGGRYIFQQSMNQSKVVALLYQESLMWLLNIITDNLHISGAISDIKELNM